MLLHKLDIGTLSATGVVTICLILPLSHKLNSAPLVNSKVPVL